MDTTIIEFQAQDIAVRDLIKFFIAKDIDPNCPACEHGTTAIQADNENNVRFSLNEFVEFKDNRLFKVSGVIHPSVMTVCNNCGYIRHFSAHRIIEWVNQQAREEDNKE